jgi:hypothetical protein
MGTGFDALGEADFVVFVEERAASDVGEVQMDEVFVVASRLARERHEQFLSQPPRRQLRLELELRTSPALEARTAFSNSTPRRLVSSRQGRKAVPGHDAPHGPGP